MNIDEIKSLSTAKLEELRDEITKNMIEIRTQVDAAKFEAANSGVYANVNWFSRAKAALAYAGRDHQMILMELGKRRKEEKSRDNDLLAHRFMTICKVRLDHGLFQSILEEAKQS